MAKVKGTATITDAETHVIVTGLNPKARVTLNVQYITEDGEECFAINAYANADGLGKFEDVIELGKTFIENFTGADVDHVECDGESVTTFHAESASD